MALGDQVLAFLLAWILTTISVNAGTIAKWVRHPKRTAKQTAKAAKDAVRGKN